MAEALLDHLLSLREHAAQRTIAQALAIHSLEDVCLSMCAPVLEQVGQLWEAGKISVAGEHFCAAVIRAQLDSLFRSAADWETGPCALVGCAPGELHEIGALMLAVFLRRLGLHVVYLGQSVEAESLASMAVEIEAACVVLSVTRAEHVAALAALGQRLQADTGRRTALYVGGRALQRQPRLAESLPGEYLALGAYDAAHAIHNKYMR